eukprot:TRINITY_DN10015_c0_g1_i4.p1 TRINITY_DN10015_c0_g1~~TRINITY_DN10015_c0_g1_i4.p1  ORF type:complete len:735 (+),score=74.17 TRINITY_DN10015_c0_g1_i4:64-2268(+)
MCIRDSILEGPLPLIPPGQSNTQTLLLSALPIARGTSLRKQLEKELNSIVEHREQIKKISPSIVAMLQEEQAKAQSLATSSSFDGQRTNIKSHGQNKLEIGLKTIEEALDKKDEMSLSKMSESMLSKGEDEEIKESIFVPSEKQEIKEEEDVELSNFSLSVTQPDPTIFLREFTKHDDTPTFIPNIPVWMIMPIPADERPSALPVEFLADPSSSPSSPQHPGNADSLLEQGNQMVIEVQLGEEIGNGDEEQEVHEEILALSEQNLKSSDDLAGETIESNELAFEPRVDDMKADCTNGNIDKEHEFGKGPLPFLQGAPSKLMGGAERHNFFTTQKFLPDAFPIQDIGGRPSNEQSSGIEPLGMGTASFATDNQATIVKDTLPDPAEEDRREKRQVDLAQTLHKETSLKKILTAWRREITYFREVEEYLISKHSDLAKKEYFKCWRAYLQEQIEKDIIQCRKAQEFNKKLLQTKCMSAWINALEKRYRAVSVSKKHAMYIKLECLQAWLNLRERFCEQEKENIRKADFLKKKFDEKFKRRCFQVFIEGCKAHKDWIINVQAQFQQLKMAFCFDALLENKQDEKEFREMQIYFISRIFLHWKQYKELMVHKRNQKATLFRKTSLLKKSFKSLRIVFKALLLKLRKMKMANEFHIHRLFAKSMKTWKIYANRKFKDYDLDDYEEFVPVQIKIREGVYGPRAVKLEVKPTSTSSQNRTPSLQNMHAKRQWQYAISFNNV